MSSFVNDTGNLAVTVNSLLIIYCIRLWGCTEVTGWLTWADGSA